MAGKKQTRRFNLVLDESVWPWLNYEAARRDMSTTAYINAALAEARDNAPEDVRRNYEAFIATREA